jgi:hypothetical protein
VFEERCVKAEAARGGSCQDERQLVGREVKTQRKLVFLPLWALMELVTNVNLLYRYMPQVRRASAGR